MARTGTQFAKITSSYSSLNAYATWQLKSTDVETKKFVIRLRAYATVTSSSTYSSDTSTFKLNGKTIKSGSYSYTKGDNLIGYRDIEVSANADGTFPDTKISFYAKSYHFTATTKTITLTSEDIPRIDIGSSITDIKEFVWFRDPGVTLGIELSNELLLNYTTNLSSTINGTNYSLYQNLNNENVRLYFDEGTYDFYHDTDIADGYLSILYPLTWQEICDLIPNEKSINIPLTLETYDNLTLLATTTKNYTFTVTKAYIEYEPYLKSDDKTVEFTGSDKVFIENFSTLTVVSNVLNEGNGASVKNYKYTETQYGTDNLSEMIDTKFVKSKITTTSLQPTLSYDTIATVNDKVFGVTYDISLTDSRGFETETKQVRLSPNEDYSKLEYFLPKIENATVIRPEDTATYVKINLNGSFWNDTFGVKENALKLEYRFKLSNENDFKEWQELTPIIEENSFSYSGNIENISSELNATFEVRISDTLGNSDTIKELQVSKGKSMFDWGEDYFSWNGELCINDIEVPCFEEESTESDGSRNVQLYDSENNKIFPNVRSDAGGTSNYNSLSNLPSINGVEVKGDKTLSDYGIQAKGDYALKSEIPSTDNFATKKEVETLTTTVTNKVDKIEGKSLSTNDYTTAEKNKLLGIEEKAEVNIIEDIKVNNVSQTVTDKSVNITIPTNNNELINGAGYQTESEVNSLIASAIGDIQGIRYEVITKFPIRGEVGVIYLIANSGTVPNIYDEYIFVNGTYEKIGTTDIDLSGYAKTSDIPTKTSDLTNDSGYLNSIPSEYITETELNNKGYLTSYTETDPVFSASPSANITTTDIANWNSKQDKLVSGTNIKTINGNSILGNGDITIDSSIPTLKKSFNLWELATGVYNVLDGITLNTYDENNEPKAIELQGGLLQISNIANIWFAWDYLETTASYTYKYFGALTYVNQENYVITYGRDYKYKISEFTTNDNLKTINGNSLIGTGDITIESGSRGGIEELTSPVRLWDLEDGLYKLPNDCVVYYQGATSTTSFTLNSASFLFISAYSTDRKNFNILLGKTSNYSTIGAGYVSSSSGYYREYDLGSIKANTVGSYNLGVYLYTNNITNMNTTSYLYEGEYLFGVTSTTIGIPSEINEETRVCLKTYSNDITGQAKRTPYIRQDLYAPSLDKHWYRIVDYTDSSNTIYGEWVEIIEDLDTSNFALKTDIPDTSKFVQDSSYVHTDNNFTSAYKTNVDSNTSARHTHSNKTVLDGITSAKITNWDNKSNFSGSYNDLTNKPTIPTVPTNISAFNNDVGYLTEHQDISSKQDKLVSGTNIKTINGNSILGSGNLVIEGGSSGGTTDYSDLTNKPTINSIELSGNKTTSDLGISYNDLADKPTIPTIATTIDENSTDSEVPSAKAVYDYAKIDTYNITGSSTSVKTSTNTTIATLTVPAGTYIVEGHVNFASNSTGARKIYIGTEASSYANTRGRADVRNASSNGVTMSNISTILNAAEKTTWYLNVWQNSGSALNCSGTLRAMRIGDYKELLSSL